MTRHSLRSSFWLLLFALGTLAQPLHAQVPANSVGVKTYTGYYNDTAVYFAAFETNDFPFAAVNGIVYAPRLSQVSGSLPQMIFFMNATYPQAVVLQTEPGQADYNPLWQVLTASWVSSDPMPLITSFASALQWELQGKLMMQPTGIIFNGPVFRVNRSLNLQDTGTLAPTIAPAEFLGINPSIRTAYFMAHQGYYNDQPVTFLALEHAPGQIQFAPGAIPVPTIDASALGTAGLGGFYAVVGQPPVIDSIPIPLQQVTAGLYSGTTSTGQPASAPLYSPIWTVYTVTFKAGVTPQPLRSVAEIQQAASAGMVTVTPGRPEDTFNCPVPFYYQAGTATPTPAGNPVYTPPSTGGTSPPSTGGTPAPGTTY